MKNLFRFIILISLLKVVAGCETPVKEPMLVLATDAAFGTYTGEILKTEGFNTFRIDSLTDPKISSGYLQSFDIIILADQEVTPVRRDMLNKYVVEGGNLIAFRPDPALDALLGVSNAGTGSLDAEAASFRDGYIGIDTTSLPGNGLSPAPMHIHGGSRKYLTNGGKVIAKLYRNPEEETGFPAVIHHQYGKGQAITFAWNLPENIAVTRQGDPSKAGRETDGIPGIRAMDLFTDGWVDTSMNTMNQADEQMRLLTRCIEYLAASAKPLPRFWYFPGKLQCLVTLTNDGEYRGESDFETQLQDVDSMGAAMSLYVLETGKVSSDFATRWTNRGFEISGHPDDTKEATGPRWENMHERLLSKRQEIRDLYGLPMTTVVNHWFVWCGNDATGNPEFAAQAELESMVGFGMDVNYAHYDNNATNGHFLGPMGYDQGNFAGSGLVMKFVTSKGKVLDIYQHLNNVYDQQYMENRDTVGFFNCFKGLVDRSLEDEVYSFVSIKAHNDEYSFSKGPLMKMLDYANRKQIPVWTVSRLLDFMKMKDEARFSDIRWSGNELKFRIISSLPSEEGLTFLLPADYNDLKIENIEMNGNKGDFLLRKIKGQTYAWVTISPGSTYDVRAVYIKE